MRRHWMDSWMRRRQFGWLGSLVRVACWGCLMGMWSNVLWSAQWHGGWYLDGGGQWSRRVQVTVTNLMDRPMEGVPVPIRIGKEAGEANLLGTEAQALRVGTAQGTELLFALVGPDGKEIHTGPIPAGSTLLIPVECPPKEKNSYWIYYENPLAWQLPDFLPDRLGLVNGDVEEGEGDVPTGWTHDQPDPQHRAEWSTENPRAGRRCLKTLVSEGAQPSWIATRQSNISVRPGGRYVFRAWVRAENVKGYAGWYLHVGNNQQPMISAPMLNAGGGTYDWKQVQLEFKVPAAADRLSLGTVLWGTGTAWFDQAELESLDPPEFQVRVDVPERLELQHLASPSDWTSAPSDVRLGQRRAVIRIENFQDRSQEALLALDLAPLTHRLGGRLDREHLALVLPGKSLRPMILGERMSADVEIPARSVITGYIYYGPAAELALQEKTSPQENRQTLLGEVEQAEYARLVASRRNLVKNPSFEGSPEPLSEWISTSSLPEQKVQYGTDSPGAPRLGERSARLDIPKGIGKAWRGWTQSVAVRPGAVYLVAAWIRTQDLQEGDAQVHLHIRTAQGELSRDNPMRSTGSALKGTMDWTLVSGVFTMPEDAATLQLHLTTEGFGTLWYDGVLAVEVAVGRIVAMEGRPLGENQIAVWPVNSIVKVFPDEPAQGAACRSVEIALGGEVEKSSAPLGANASEPVLVCLARNEQEPLQLAVRSGRTWGKVRVEVGPLRGPNASVLPQPEVAVVGYVPVDYPTNYYSTTTPRWYRKVPRTSPACDGFAGWWPDPLLPQDTFVLPANKTQAVWITFQAPKEAKAGEYQGRIRLLAEVVPPEEAPSGSAHHGPKVASPAPVTQTLGQPTENVLASGTGSSEGSGEYSGIGSSGGQTILLAEIPYTVRVWNFTLPDRPHLKAIYDVRFGAGTKLWGKSVEEAYREVVEFMARRRLEPDGIRPEPIFRYQDGRVEADFTEFDKAAHWYFDQLGLRHSYTPWHFYLFGWGHPPKRIGQEAPYPGEPPYEKADRAVLRPEYKRVYQEALRLFWSHLKEKGWADRFVLYISDEPFFRQPDILAQMKALCTMIHEVDPAIPIYSSTWHHVPQWDDSLDVWGIGHYGIVPLEQMARLRASGKRVWFTTDGQMCLDTPYCAIERMLPHYCFHYGAEAYEFWGVAWTTYPPYQFGWHAYIHQSDQPGKSYWVRYPNGDGYLIYPGRPIGHEGPVSSIRLEQARDGVEDYEYLYMLQKTLSQLPADSSQARQIHQVLQEAASLLSFPNPGGRYSTRILPDPDRLVQIRRRLAETLEALPSPRP